MPHFRTKRAPPFDNIYIYIYLYPIRAPGPTKMPHNVFLFPDNKRNMKRSSFIFLYYSVLLLLLLLLSSAFGEEDLTQQFSERLDVCSMNLLDGVNVSSILGVNPINERLAGKTLSVAAMWDPGYVSIEGGVAPARTKVYPDVYCTDCGSQLSGYNFEVFEKMAEIGNFKTNWTIFGDIDDSRGETYEQLALNFTRDFDVSGNWWSDTARRRSIGISCGYYHTDVTRMLTVLQIEGRETFSLFMLFAPFQSYIWIVLLGVFLLVSTAFVMIDHDFDLSTISDFWGNLVQSMWNNWTRFACGGDSRDQRSNTGKIVQVSFGFVRLVIVALYGASLTSILIEEANTSGTIKTMSDLQNAGGKVIMFNGDPLKPRILSQNPWLIVTDVPRGEILSSTNFGSLLDKYDSDAVILAAPDAATVAQQSDVCDVLVTGVVIQAGGGFITSFDNCLSDVNFILDSILMSMESDGTLDYITASYANKKCTSVIPTTTAVSKYQIGLFRVSGIFILGGCALVGVTILRAAYFTALHRD